VFVHDRDVDALRLVGQVWGAGEDTGAVVVGIWTVPLEGSVCGRVYRTRAAALCADISLDPDYRSFPGGRSRSSMTVPFGPDGEVVGVINVEAPWTSAFSIADYERLTKVAASAASWMPRSEMPRSATPRSATPDEAAPPAV
jgi:GAF domain